MIGGRPRRARLLLGLVATLAGRIRFTLEAFRKRHGGVIKPDRVIEILIFDSTFPRSARFCLERIAASLSRIMSEGGGEGPRRVPPGEGLVNILRNGSAGDAIAQAVHGFLLNIQSECAATASMVFDQHMSLG